MCSWKDPEYDKEAYVLVEPNKHYKLFFLNKVRKPHFISSYTKNIQIEDKIGWYMGFKVETATSVIWNNFSHYGNCDSDNIE
jgi:hypothetical protein